MRRRIATATLLAMLAASGTAHAQGLLGGAEIGAERGREAAGAIGAIVGGAVGAATGAVNGALGLDQRPRFRSYVVQERRPSYAYAGEVRVGALLPREGVTFYEVPAEYGVTGYRYAIVNDVAVLVDPATGRIVEIVD